MEGGSVDNSPSRTAGDGADSPEVVVHTGNESIEQSAAKILAYLESKNLIAKK